MTEHIQDELPLACGMCGFPLGSCTGHTLLDVGEDWCKFCKDWCMTDNPPGCQEYVTWISSFEVPMSHLELPKHRQAAYQRLIDDTAVQRLTEGREPCD